MQPVPFEQFMARALHHPEHGYYARRIAGVGRHGDFTTAPMLSDTPARAIAAWVTKALKETGCRDVIEVGPGEGKLAAGVLKHLPRLNRWRTRFHLVETSTPLAVRQRDLLGKRVRYHKTIQEALATCGGNAVIYSNELVDAFPVRRFQKTPDGWKELAIEYDEKKRVRELLLPPAPLPPSSGFLEGHRMGQWIEVHDSYRLHLGEWLPLWKSGRMLTIDYGAVTEDLYHRKPRGTLRAYLLQHRLEGPAIYENPGRQDLTADVNFTDLMDWSRRWTSAQSLTSFGGFLHRHVPDAESELTDPEGVGGAFLVLEQRR